MATAIGNIPRDRIGEVIGGFIDGDDLPVQVDDDPENPGKYLVSPVARIRDTHIEGTVDDETQGP